MTSVRQQILWLVAAITVLVPVLQAEPFNGYNFYPRSNQTQTYLTDLSNATVRTWTASRNGGYCAYLLDNGHILRSAVHNNPTFNGGGGQGYVQEYDWNNTLVWEYLYSNTQHRAHHDLEKLPNGNVLVIAWEYKSGTEAMQAGLNRNAALWPEHLVEIEPSGSNGGTIVWEWHAWDHLIQDYSASRDNYGVIADHPELIDINLAVAGGPGGGTDWMHFNGVNYNPERDEIVISSHELDEIYVIDHSTTTEEAASHSGGNRGRGGDILYRWGKPSNYDAPGAAVINVVHCANWIAAGLPGEGHILAFNNREGTNASHIIELIPPRDENGNYIWTPGTAYGPATPDWEYSATGFYANHLGWCQRQPNGNTVISESTSGYLFEVNSVGEVQWFFQAAGEIISLLRYAPCYPGLSALGVCPPSDLTVIRSGTNIELRWAASGSPQYRVYRLQNPTDPVSMGTLISTVTASQAILANEIPNYSRAFYAVTSYTP